MERIKSFTINHDILVPGFYISRVDGDITTYDMRTRRPNMGDYMSDLTMHSVEHMFATYIRNSELAEDVIYFGPMGCRTGFYLILAGEYESKDIVPLLKELYTFMSEFEGDVPGACARDCGNYLDMNLPMAKYLSKKYLTDVLENISEERLIYPE